MSFNGPFGVSVAREPSVTFVNTVWQATELGFGGGEVSSFKNDKSRLARDGRRHRNLRWRREHYRALGQPTGSTNTLEAAGAVAISGDSGDKLYVSLENTGIVGGTSVEVRLFGTGSALKAER